MEINSFFMYNKSMCEEGENMGEKFIDSLLKKYPELVEALEDYIFVPRDIYEARYASDDEYYSYTLVYDLITNERFYSYVYALFYEFTITGNHFAVGYVDEKGITSIDISRAKLASSIIKYQRDGKLQFESVYRDRVDEILNKTDWRCFYNQHKDDTYHIIIDGDDVEVSFCGLLDFINLPYEEFHTFFRNYDDLYQGVRKDYYLYAVISLLNNSMAFVDYRFPEQVIYRFNVLKSNEIVDLEALNKIKVTLDPTIDKISISEELQHAVLENMNSSLSVLEKAIYIYIKLCKLLSYDDEFYAVNQRGYIALKHENLDGIVHITPENSKVVCYEFNSIYAKFLDKLKIKFVTKSAMNGFYKGHTNLIFRVGKFLVEADSVKSILKCDLVSAKLNNPLTGLRCINTNEDTIDDFNYLLSSIYFIIGEEENQSDKVEEVETFEDIVASYEEYSSVELDLDTKLKIMLDKVIQTGMKGVDSIAYLLQLRKIIFNDKECKRNIKISIVRDNINVPKNQSATVSAIFTINKDDIYEDILANQYYLFHPNYPLVPISIMDIEELFRSKMLEYIGDRYLEIPGLKVEEDSLDDNKTQGYK